MQQLQRWPRWLNRKEAHQYISIADNCSYTKKMDYFYSVRKMKV